MSFGSSNGRPAIVLEHAHEDASHHHADAPDGVTHAAAPTSDHDRDHVVELPGAGAIYATPSVPQSPHAGGIALALAATIDFAFPHAPLVSCVARSRVGPPVPSRSSILRI